VSKPRASIVLSLLVVLPLFLQCCEKRDVEESVLARLPYDADLDGWEAEGEPQTAEGEDLFELINGGAEIYHEYGFRRAAIQSYSKRAERTINVELYEMEDPASAYGAYSFKIGKTGEPIYIGDEGKLEDYYLSFWKGHFVVTVVGYDTAPETREGLMVLARAIDERIPEGGGRPEPVGLLLGALPEPARVTYMEGGLALSNRLPFDAGNTLGLRQGAVAEYDTHSVFLFAYEDEDESREWNQRARDRLEGDEFHDFRSYAEGFSVQDAAGQVVYVVASGRFMLICVGLEHSAARTVIASVLERQRPERAE